MEEKLVMRKDGFVASKAAECWLGVRVEGTTTRHREARMHQGLFWLSILGWNEELQ
jgi:hypothetical protein